MRPSLLLLATAATLVTAQTGPTRAKHVFTIRAPEPFSEEDRKVVCDTEGACTECGTGVCISTEECGTWAGKKDYCCIQPYNFGTGDRLKCADAAGIISNINVADGSADGDEPKTYDAQFCPSGEIIVNESFLETEGGNLTCCAVGKDAVVLESGTLSVPQQVLCIDEVTGSSGGGGGGNGGGDKQDGGSKENGAGRLRFEMGALAVLVAVFSAGLL